MKADPFPIGAMLKDPRRFVVPIYQRTYQWKIRPQLETFFEEVEAKAQERLTGNPHLPHYMGAVLVMPRGAYSFGRMQVLDVVDGQQRIMTFQVFISAIRDLARALGENEIADSLGMLILNSEGPQVREHIERYKLYPTAYDRVLFFDLIDCDNDQLRKKYSDEFYKNGNVVDGARALLQAWGFFRSEAADFVELEGATQRAQRLAALSSALVEDFQTIVITLDEHDDAQVIFETLNSNGEPLAAMDLVRNDVFHRAVRGGEDVELLMKRRWATFEEGFWKEPATRGRIRKQRMDFFLSDTLAAETGRELILTELYARYKNFVSDHRFPSVDAELDVLLRHAPTYRTLADPVGTSALSELGRELSAFDVSTAYPLVFVIEASDASDYDKATLYSLIISYVVRRLLCGLTAKNYNNTFVRIASQLRRDGVSLEHGVKAFAALDGPTVEFPGDADLRDAILTRRQYGNMQQLRLRHILAKLEHASRDKFDEPTGVPVDLTIEHILPEEWWQHWPLPDGTQVSQDYMTGMTGDQLNAIRRRDQLKHSLGNLTLLTDSRNPSLGNVGFSSKREDLRKSLLKLNHDVADRATWSESEIQERGAALYDLAVKIWPGLSNSETFVH